MSDLGTLSYYLGIEVAQHEDSISLKQYGYARNFFIKARIDHCNPSQYPMEPKLELIKHEGGTPVDPTAL